jgi:TnpA family transposase
MDADPELRKRVQVGLNKGEARNAPARAVFFNRQGELATELSKISVTVPAD